MTSRSVSLTLILVLGTVFFATAVAWAGCGTFWQDEDQTGTSRNFCNLFEFVGNDWNDRISSYDIDEYSECVACEHSNFAGRCIYLHPGDSVTFMDQGWDNVISSLNCRADGFFTTNHMGSQRGEAWLHAQYSGVALNLTISTNITNLTSANFNDSISSIILGSGIGCKFCKDKDFGGGCFTLGPNSTTTTLDRSWNDKISSIACYPE